ncbi:hypothetical protein D0Y65_043773 [Glycine soja]|uniref:Reverse transcriptase zinc-binding domain-containing protein n=1 Tax=Glycine soja TaxID=3848 RepID=A0A445GIW6_GLYSO|nr:hypothetical protein D0Y65_043773 [Glycine soja]
MESFGEAGWEWEFSWRRNLFDNELGRASAFIDQATALSPNAALKDYWVWGADPKGIFSTSTAYLCIKGDQPIDYLNCGFSQLWEIKVPPRALSFAWRLLWDRTFVQIEVLRQQLELAKELNKPASVHCVCAFGDLLELMKSMGPFPAGVILHSYLGSAEMVPEFSKLGAYFSFSGFLMSQKANKAKKMLKMMIFITPDIC